MGIRIVLLVNISISDGLQFTWASFITFVFGLQQF